MLIIWDYFGVITLDSFWDIATKLAVRASHETEMRTLHGEVNLGHIAWDEFCEKVALLIGIDAKEVSKLYNDLDINPRVVTLISELHGKHHQVILSNASSNYLLSTLDRLGLRALLDDVFVSSSLGFAKPDEKAYLHVLNECKTEPRDAIFIDDSERNVEAAIALGIKGIVYRQEVDIRSEINRYLI